MAVHAPLFFIQQRHTHLHNPVWRRTKTERVCVKLKGVWGDIKDGGWFGCVQIFHSREFKPRKPIYGVFHQREDVIGLDVGIRQASLAETNQETTETSQQNVFRARNVSQLQDVPQKNVQRQSDGC